MKCENCGENDANVRYTQIINGVKKEMQLCDKCADELGIGKMNMNFDMPFGFSNFFGELLNEYNSDGFMPTLALPKTLKCDRCGFTFDDFIDSGKFGCPSCYDTFEERIDPIFKRLQGSNRYIGRGVKKANPENELNIKLEKEETQKENKIDGLKRELKQMIKEEKYEEAAKIRDEIKKLEKKEEK